MKSRRVSYLLLAIALGANVWPANAQGTVGTITGSVADSNGAPLPGATVTVTASRKIGRAHV